MFIGREDELALIQEILSQPRGSMMIYGKRKIGKTTLLMSYQTTAKKKK